MKQKDIALILVISFMSLVLGLVVSNMVFGGKGSKNLTAVKVIPITTEFNQPDKKYFNSNAVDPTQLIQIGNNSNQQPFNQ